MTRNHLNTEPPTGQSSQATAPGSEEAASKPQAPNVARFLANLWLQGGLAVSTRAAYAYELDRLSQHLGAARVDSATEVVLREYLLAMHHRGVRAAAVRRATIVLRRYYAWLAYAGLRLDNPAAQLEVQQPPRRHSSLVTPRQADELLKATSGQHPREALRDKALVALAYGAGLRLADLLSLKPVHVDLVASRLVVFDKRQRCTSVALAADVAKALKDYLEQGRPAYLRPGEPAPEALFLTRLGAEMTASGLWKHLQALASRAGLEPVDVTVTALRMSHRNTA